MRSLYNEFRGVCDHVIEFVFTVAAAGLICDEGPSGDVSARANPTTGFLDSVSSWLYCQ